jgi:hypothetical protein
MIGPAVTAQVIDPKIVRHDQDDMGMRRILVRPIDQRTYRQRKQNNDQPVRQDRPASMSSQRRKIHRFLGIHSGMQAKASSAI